MFAILFGVLLIEIQEEIHHFLGWEGGEGVKGHKNCEQKFCEQTGVSYCVFVLYDLLLVGKCSAIRCSVAAPPPGARHGLGGLMHPRHPLRGDRERGVRQARLGGGVAAGPLLHTQNCGMSRDRGVGTPWSATGGGCSVCPTKDLL